MVRQTTSFRTGGRGFSLVELLIATALLAILAAIGIPAFERIIAQNRLAAAVNELVWALKVTRNHAVRGNYRAVLCASADQMTCSGNWHDGWIIFMDYSGSAKPTSILHARNGFPKQVSITGNNKIKKNIAFNANGGLGALSGLLQNGTFTVSVEGGETVQIVVSTSGRPKLVKLAGK